MQKSRIYTVILAYVQAFIVALMIPAYVYAVPASPDVHVLEQPDGTQFYAVQWGDENLHGWETEDGYSIVFEPIMKAWTYADRSFDGSLAGTAYVAGKEVPPVTLKKHIRPSFKKGTIIQKRMTTKEELVAAGVVLPPLPPLKREPQQSADGPEYIVPSVGSGNMPLILITFPGKAATFSPANFNSLLFGTDTFSMKDYYDEVSYGAFHLSAGPGILGASVPVAGWYTSSKSHDYYGFRVSSSQNDAYPGTLVREAVNKADQAGFQFEAYDSDGDCYVDVVAIVHQGTGQEASGISTDIWSHRWNLYSANYYGESDGGEFTTSRDCPGHPGVKMKVNDYIIMPEKYGTGISTMGVFAHEYGHSFGLPDLYDTDYSSNGIGNWSLMAGGSWTMVNRPGDRPAHMDAWSKFFLGWVAPTLVTSAQSNVSIAAAENTPQVFKLLSGQPKPASGEYFLVENRQKTGFDKGLPGSGLLIWHIAEDQTTNDNECLSYPGWECDSSYHYHVALVQADNKYDLEWPRNRGDAGDPFPGSSKKIVFSPTSHASNNSSLYNGWPNATSNVIVADISASGPVMTASMTAQSIPVITLASAVDNPTLNAASLVFSTNGWSGQPLVAFSGGSAAQSGNIGNGQSTYMETQITGPASVSFYWKVSSQPVYDTLKLTVDNKLKATISGTVNWQQKSVILPAGTHTVRWSYTKNASVASGMDAAWVDKIVVNPYTKLTLLTPNGGGMISAGTNTTVTWTAPAQAEQFNLYYTTNNGISWKLIALGLTGSSYDWTVPSVTKDVNAKVKVTGYTAKSVLVGADTSNTNFMIMLP